MNKTDIIKFFDKRARDWDSELTPNDFKMEEILNAAGVLPGDSVLDIACGTGVMISYYKKRGVSFVTGIDISQGMIEAAREKFSEDDSVELVCADAEGYSFDRQYDRCIIFNAFPHFCSPKMLFDNIYKALKKGSTLTVAHDRGRVELDAHHSKTASSVSNGLMSENELEKIFLSCGFTDIYKKATDEIYIVSGKRK